MPQRPDIFCIFGSEQSIDQPDQTIIIILQVHLDISMQGGRSYLVAQLDDLCVDRGIL